MLRLFNFRCPATLFDRYGRMVRETGFSKSEHLRDMMMNSVIEHEISKNRIRDAREIESLKNSHSVRSVRGKGKGVSNGKDEKEVWERVGEWNF